LLVPGLRGDIDECLTDKDKDKRAMGINVRDLVVECAANEPESRR